MTDKRKKPGVRGLKPLKLPLHCITPSALRGLATTIERLVAFHKKAGGTSPHEPCLSAVSIDKNGLVTAHVHSNGNVHNLVYSHGSWESR